jgi:hypothetical protein
MVAILTTHKVTVAGADANSAKVYYCKLRPGTYTSIETLVGIGEASDTEENNAITSVSELIRAGVLFRMVTSGGTLGNKKSFNILVTRDKISTAMDGIKGKTINGVIVKAGRIKRRASFY